MHQYARYVDGGNASRIAELFTDDGKWIGADGGTMNGKAEILRAFTGRQGLTRRQSRHVITNQLVDVIDEDHATGIAYLINYRHDSKTGVAERLANCISRSVHSRSCATLPGALGNSGAKTV